LPYASQLEVRVPYVRTREERVTAATFTETGNASGVGDIELGVTKEFIRERGARPTVLGNLTWKTHTGAFHVNRVSPGTGFQSVQATLTTVKRQDPLVFFGNLSYTATFARTLDDRRIAPGNGVGFKVGTLLAASPQTSLRTAFEASRVGRTVIEGAGTPGSGATVGFLELGAASLLTTRSLLDFQLSIGVTPDSPRFRLDVSLPVRFQ
jgi:hypothetical protein